jgi:hypothetical protein
MAWASAYNAYHTGTRRALEALGRVPPPQPGTDGRAETPQAQADGTRRVPRSRRAPAPVRGRMEGRRGIEGPCGSPTGPHRTPMGHLLHRCLRPDSLSCHPHDDADESLTDGRRWESGGTRPMVCTHQPTRASRLVSQGRKDATRVQTLLLVTTSRTRAWRGKPVRARPSHVLQWPRRPLAQALVEETGHRC